MFPISQKNLAPATGFQMPNMSTVQPMSGYQLPSGGPNVGRPMPQQPMGMPAVTSGGLPQQPMGTPTTGFQMPDMSNVQPISGQSDPFAKVSMSGYTRPPMDVATAIACGIPPSQVANPNSSAFGPTQAPTVGGMMDIFNRPPSGMGGMPQPQVSQMPSFGAPSMPNAVDQGLGMQQMNHGNPMGGMNNWFSNFTAPRPMPAPAPMMPMKGMFGVR